MSRPSPHTRQAFSLVEILAVFAVVAIMAGLLIPAIRGAQESSQRAKCISNLKQIGAALFAYAADHGQQLPPVSSVWPPSDEKQTWGYAIWPYAGYEPESYVTRKFDLRLLSGAAGDNIFRCPSNRKTFTPTPQSSDPVNANKVSYGLNPRPVGVNTSPIPLSNVTTPAKAAMVMECSFYLGDPWAYFRNFGLIPHSGSSNILFYDGHVESMKFDQIPKSDTGDGRFFWNGRQ